jgi:anti-sigma factor RsiW
MKQRPDKQEWEEQVNALLDGELNDVQAGALKAAAASDQALAQAIIEAYQLQQALNALPLERAPDSLRRKLQRIPRERREPWLAFALQPRWAVAFALLAVVALLVTQQGPQQPSAAEIAQARHELAVAFAYLDKVGEKTGFEIRAAVDSGMQETVTEPVFKTITEQFEFNKERKA